MSRLARQSFLGVTGEQILHDATIGVVGLGGGGSHIVQQLAHVGVGGLVIVDHDTIEDTNTNRLVGSTLADVEAAEKKVNIAKRIVLGLVPDCRIEPIDRPWQEALEELRRCDVILGAVDSLICRDELERFCRANLIPYVDIGMDVTAIGEHGFLIAGQVAMSLPDGPCLRCFKIVNDERLTEEAKRYGDAGSRPQVVWPNGVLASTAVGLAIKLLTPWHTSAIGPVFLQYDGNLGTMRQSPQMKYLPASCLHHLPAARGDAFFDIRDFPKFKQPGAEARSEESIATSAPATRDTLMQLVLAWLQRLAS